MRGFDARALGIAAPGPTDPRLAAIPDTPRLDLPTYDGSDQVVHPDVLVEPDRFIMAMTPYPYSNDRFENPSIVVGSDGITFAPLGPEPIVPPPPHDHNDDPDLRRDPRTGEYELLYLETERPERETVVALDSPDLIGWTRRDALVDDLTVPDPFIVSPAAIDVGGETHMFFVNAAGNQLETLATGDGTWDLRTATPVAIDTGAMHPWHVDVIPAGSAFALLISGFTDSFEHQNLYLATSTDLASWTLAPAPLLDAADPALGVESLYRSTGVISGDRLVVWYSMQYR